MRQIFLSAVAALALGLSGGAAAAASVTFERVDLPGGAAAPRDDAPGAAGGIVEDFAGHATPGGSNRPVNPLAEARTEGNEFASAVGVFAGLGGTGSGTSRTGDTTRIQIRSGINAGRFNVLDPGGNFLDSNDTLGFSWTILNRPGLLGARAFVTDPNDAGQRLTVRLVVDGAELFRRTLDDRKADATVWRLDADFTSLAMGWTSAVFEFRMSGENDGIGLSNARLDVIPLPAPALLLLTGLGALGALARRRRSA